MRTALPPAPLDLRLPIKAASSKTNGVVAATEVVAREAAEQAKVAVEEVVGAEAVAEEETGVGTARATHIISET